MFTDIFFCSCISCWKFKSKVKKYYLFFLSHVLLYAIRKRDSIVPPKAFYRDRKKGTHLFVPTCLSHICITCIYQLTMFSWRYFFLKRNTLWINCCDKYKKHSFIVPYAVSDKKNLVFACLRLVSLKFPVYKKYKHSLLKIDV